MNFVYVSTYLLFINYLTLFHKDNPFSVNIFQGVLDT